MHVIINVSFKAFLTLAIISVIEIARAGEDFPFDKKSLSCSSLTDTTEILEVRDDILSPTGYTAHYLRLFEFDATLPVTVTLSKDKNYHIIKGSDNSDPLIGKHLKAYISRSIHLDSKMDFQIMLGHRRPVEVSYNKIFCRPR